LAAAVLAALGTTVPAPRGAAYTLAASLIEDAYIASNEAGTVHYNHPGSVDVGVYARNHPGVSRAGFLQFEIPAISSPATVTGVTVTGYWRNVYTGDLAAQVVGLDTDPDLTALTWNSALAAGYITGRDGTDYRVLWGAEAVPFVGEGWSTAGWVLRQPAVYTDTTPGDGLLKFINDRRVQGVPLVVTLGVGGAADDTDYYFGLISSEANDTNPEPDLPAGYYAQTMELTLLEIPEPASLAVLALAGLALGRRGRRGES